MKSTEPLLIAHRGDTTNFPENTLEGFLSAFEKGAGGVEMDIHLYQGEIIVVHKYNRDYNTQYPLFSDVLKQTHDKGRLEIELKAFDTQIIEPLKKILDNYPQADIELTTSEIPLAPYTKEAFPQRSLGMIFHDFLIEDWMTPELAAEKLIGWGAMSKVDRLHVSVRILKQFGGQQLVEAIHAAGFEVSSHLFDVPEQKTNLSLLTGWGVDQFTVDNFSR